MTKFYQMVCYGDYALWDAKFAIHSKKVFASKESITDEIEYDFIEKCCNPSDENNIYFLEKNNNLTFRIVELELQDAN